MFRDAGLGEGFPGLTPKAQATKTRGFTRGKDGGAGKHSPPPRTATAESQLKHHVAITQSQQKLS